MSDPTMYDPENPDDGIGPPPQGLMRPTPRGGSFLPPPDASLYAPVGQPYHPDVRKSLLVGLLGILAGGASGQPGAGGMGAAAAVGGFQGGQKQAQDEANAAALREQAARLKQAAAMRQNALDNLTLEKNAATTAEARARAAASDPTSPFSIHQQAGKALENAQKLAMNPEFRKMPHDHQMSLAQSIIHTAPPGAVNDIAATLGIKEVRPGRSFDRPDSWDAPVPQERPMTAYERIQGARLFEEERQKDFDKYANAPVEVKRQVMAKWNADPRAAVFGTSALPVVGDVIGQKQVPRVPVQGPPTPDMLQSGQVPGLGQGIPDPRGPKVFDVNAQMPLSPSVQEAAVRQAAEAARQKREADAAALAQKKFAFDVTDKNRHFENTVDQQKWQRGMEESRLKLSQESAERDRAKAARAAQGAAPDKQYISGQQARYRQQQDIITEADAKKTQIMLAREKAGVGHTGPTARPYNDLIYAQEARINEAKAELKNINSDLARYQPHPTAPGRDVHGRIMPAPQTPQPPTGGLTPAPSRSAPSAPRVPGLSHMRPPAVAPRGLTPDQKAAHYKKTF